MNTVSPNTKAQNPDNQQNNFEKSNRLELVSSLLACGDTQCWKSECITKPGNGKYISIVFELCITIAVF